ncbi:MAG TPA: lipoprotein [Candidatus Margulisiibacteriota bacterium]|nr:lipoprotein [Candidatus Margulisiibacteriota bacterium]
MQQRRILAAVVASLVALALGGCGQTGSDPPYLPEVLFQVRPAGQATFRVDSLVGGGASYTSVIGQEFTATSGFNFALENACPPFLGRFTLLSGAQITVTVSVISGGGQTEMSDTATQPGTTATVSANPSQSGCPAPSGTPAPSTPEVRFDVCAALPGELNCATMQDPPGIGTFGVVFTGSIGDEIFSHQTSGTTPTIYFFQAPQENVNAVFRPQTVTGGVLQGQLFINGQLQQTVGNSQEVLIKQDL